MIPLFEKRVVMAGAGMALGLLVMSGYAVGRAGRQAEDAFLSRSMAPVVRLMEAAHRQRDDVALQRLVHGLTRAPGVLWAGVLDTQQERFIVHGEPARIGKKSGDGRASWSALLEEDGAAWGKLTIGFSKDIQARFRRTLFVGEIVCALGFLAFIVLQAGYGVRQTVLFNEQKADMQALLKEAREALAQADRQSEKQESLLKRSLNSALEQLPHAALLLDERQQVMASNSFAARLLGCGTSEDLLGRSWQDIPALSDCGKILTEALENPKKTFRLTLPAPKWAIDLWALGDAGASSSGMWIILRPALES